MDFHNSKTAPGLFLLYNFLENFILIRDMGNVSRLKISNQFYQLQFLWNFSIFQKWYGKCFNTECIFFYFFYRSFCVSSLSSLLIIFVKECVVYGSFLFLNVVNPRENVILYSFYHNKYLIQFVKMLTPTFLLRMKPL